MPRLWRRPVIVLSNNDGCVVARSPEAKALGIPMGIPFFQIRHLCQRHQVACFSANFELYASLSHRVMLCLRQWSADMEIYSIDEAFLKLPPIEEGEMETFQQNLIQTVFRWTGIPVSVGIAPTKTLAKAANHLAKRLPQHHFTLTTPESWRTYLPQIPVEEVWGVGRRTVKTFQQRGIRTAWDLSQMDPLAIRREFSIVLERTVRELCGECCLELENQPSPKQSIQVSRSFGKKLQTLEELEHPVATFLQSALEKLRRQKSYATAVYLFLGGKSATMKTENWGTTPFSTGTTVELARTSDDSLEVLPQVLKSLKKIFVPGISYTKAGVTLLGLTSTPFPDKYRMFQSLEQNQQEDAHREKHRQLMATLDQLHRQLGKRSVHFAVEGLEQEQDWKSRQEWKSPAYTTRWEEIPKVR
ncbi:MAG: Y-family DNA polymerase [Planctomycetia bacterium]|nr:Y-family DNA polymerase [Planctomycetia bacterium]